jgi:solute carrier family 35 protein E3|uniref:Sugar phosphate transporter domain-containing protein n=1 Tax=Eutreptiella gymnastica TaxID=73025 RepID=A0A7S4LKM3_9EUGL|eukprot:CAMPEP_0174313430 /NCGR_PEP_ID=MMETSP0810-20121108/4965_1 /TAXON_ID=73025 ORGANISM="Eutreptiella gymnastica-like, Strain CCMP1594" /NCGR_SAMPLE_ID=MMETSP0810 /ASSEMBLY_ACC=CAM_ASM_000659 /LENGTH=311 /DNA_ID=CAMNT_0015422181 /DNA_START=33 /DNA_END=968 /DNA_ORIENTATION=-
MSAARTAFSVSLNIVAAVALILVNKKAVFEVANFHFGTALTIMHFLFTWACCVAAAACGTFEPKMLDIVQIFKLSLVFSSYILFQNMSLVHNSVGFYQIMKIANTPAILIMEYILYGKKQGYRVLVSLVVICFGIFAAVFTEPKLNLVGTIHAVLAVLFNSLYTIWGKHKQDELKCNSPQLLLFQAPVSAAFLLVPLFFDKFGGLITYSPSTTGIMFISISCLTAAVVNLSFFWMVGRTNAITANVVGYVKTVFVFLGGFVLFADALTLQNMVGITITLVGSAVFMWAQMKDNDDATKQKMLDQEGDPQSP